MNHLKIVFYIGSLSLGGIGKMSIQLAKEFSKKGHKVHFFLNKKINDYNPPSCAETHYGNGRATNSIRSLINYLNKEQPDILISARDYLNAAANLAVLISKSKTKTISTIRTNQSAQDYNENKKSMFDFLIKSAYGIAYQKSNAIIAVSQGVKDDFETRHPSLRKNVYVIHNPAQPTSNETQKIRQNISQLAKNEYILSVGRLSKQKNQRLLIHAHKNVMKKKPNLYLFLAGSGPEEKLLREEANALGLNNKIKFLGVCNQSELALLYKNASLFVLPSKWEGFGNVLVEALYYGCPVVSSDCPSGPSEIIQSDEHGQLFKVNSLTDLTAKIKLSLSKSYNKNQLNSYSYQFSSKRIADRYEKVMYAILD